MSNTRSLMEKMNTRVNESIGLRQTDSRPQLSPVASARDVGRRAKRQFGQLDIDRVQPDPDQPRAEFDPESLQQLAASIRDQGQLAPIRVRWSEQLGSWLIISGERRWRAARQAGLKTIDCCFQEDALSPTQILAEQLIENLLRVDLKPVEEAESFQKLISINQWNGKELAAALNISPTRVSRALALLKLPHDMRVRINTGDVSARAGYELSKLPASQIAKALPSEGPVTATDAVRIARRQRRTKSAEGRGTHQIFHGDDGWKVIVSCSKKGTYHDIEQTLQIAIEEVQLRIRNRIDL